MWKSAFVGVYQLLNLPTVVQDCSLMFYACDQPHGVNTTAQPTITDLRLDLFIEASSSKQVLYSARCTSMFIGMNSERCWRKWLLPVYSCLDKTRRSCLERQFRTEPFLARCITPLILNAAVAPSRPIAVRNPAYCHSATWSFIPHNSPASSSLLTSTRGTHVQKGMTIS